MKKKNDPIEENIEIPVAENVEPVAVEETPAESAPIEIAPAEEIPVTESAPIEVAPAETASDPIPLPAEAEPEPAPASSAPEPASVAPSSSEPAPSGYGAPQMLYEDFIPYEYLHDTPERSADTRSEEPKKKKKLSREDELLAAVEAEMASQEAESAAAPVNEPAVSPRSETSDPAPVVPVIPVATSGEEENSMADAPTDSAPKPREYTPYERRLRRKYKLDKDILLSENDIVPGFILAKGENMVRCYHCIDSRKGEGTLCLTNKRLLINTDEHAEVAVEDVMGIKFSKNTYFSFFKFLFALIFLGLGAFMILLPFVHTGMNIPSITGESWKEWFKYLFIACGAVSVLISFPLWKRMVKSYFYFSIFVREGAPFIECKSRSVVKGEKKGTQFNFILSDAGKESEKAARELGALLLEVKDGRYNF